MKRILYVSPFSHIGGGEVSLLTLLKGLDRRRYAPHVISYAEGPFIREVRALDIPTCVVERRGALSDSVMIFRLCRYIREHGISLVHVNSLDIRAACAARLAGADLVGHLRVIFPFAWPDALFVRLSRVTIAVSRAASESFAARYPSCLRKMVVVPNAVGMPDAVTPADLRSEYLLPRDARLFGAAGRIDRWKGYEDLIKAAPMVIQREPRAYFFIVGGAEGADGEAYLRELTELIGKLGLEGRVILTGFRKDILSTLAAFETVVIPSRVFAVPGGVKTEAFGRVAVEAMALGLPVVATRVGGLCEIVDDGVTGTLVPPCDHDAVAGALLRLLGDPALRDAMGRAGRERYERCYTITAHLKAIEAIYEGARPNL